MPQDAVTCEAIGACLPARRNSERALTTISVLDSSIGAALRSQNELAGEPSRPGLAPKRRHPFARFSEPAARSPVLATQRRRPGPPL